MAENPDDLNVIQRKLEYSPNPADRMKGGLLVQTGLHPMIFQKLESFGLKSGYRAMIGDVTRKFVQGSEPLPAEGTADYEALAEFMYHPDVLRQIVMLQNLSLKGTEFVRSSDQIMAAVLEKVGTDAEGKPAKKNIDILINTIRESVFDATKDDKRAKELGLTKDDVKRITEDPDARKEYGVQIAYAVKSKPEDLLANAKLLETFSYLSSPLTAHYVKDSLHALRSHLTAEITKGSVTVSDRAKQFALQGFLPLLDVKDASDDQTRIRIRNVLWAMQSYGLATIPFKKDEKTGAVTVFPLEISRSMFNESGKEVPYETATELFVRYIEMFLGPEEEAKANAQGHDVITPDIFEWVLKQKKARGELTDDDKKAVERFTKGQGNPIYFAITRLKKGKRPTIEQLMRQKAVAQEQKAAADTQLAEWDTLTADQLVDNPQLFENRLALIPKESEREAIRRKLKDFKSIRELFEAKDGKPARVATVLEGVDRALDEKINTRANATERDKLLTNLRAVLSRVNDFRGRINSEFNTIDREIKVRRGIRYVKAQKKWSNPSNPETNFTKFLDVFKRSVKSLDTEPRVVRLSDSVASIEKLINFYQTILPVARRQIRNAEVAIEKHGKDRPAQVETIKASMQELETALINWNIHENPTEFAKRTRLLGATLEQNIQLIAPAPDRRDGATRQRHSLKQSIQGKEGRRDRSAARVLRAAPEMKIVFPDTMDKAERDARLDFYGTKDSPGVRQNLQERIRRGKIGVPREEADRDTFFNAIYSHVQTKIIPPILAADVAVFSDPTRREELRANVEKEVKALLVALGAEKEE